MNDEKYTELEERANDALLEEIKSAGIDQVRAAIRETERVQAMAREKVRLEIENMIAEGKAWRLSEEEDRLLKAFREFRQFIPAAAGPATFMWHTQSTEVEPAAQLTPDTKPCHDGILCTCPCHSSGPNGKRFMMHCMPCCDVCPKCGANYVRIPKLAQTPELPSYRSHKIVRGFKITEVRAQASGSAVLVGENGIERMVGSLYMRKHEPKVGGYFVLYLEPGAGAGAESDGYESWSPAKAFEKGYTRI